MKISAFYQIITCFSIIFAVPFTSQAQGKKGLVIPMSAYDYYTSDSTVFYYNYAYALNTATQCNPDESAKMDALLTPEQKAFAYMVRSSGTEEGGGGVLTLMANPNINKEDFLAGLRALGALDMASFLQSIEGYLLPIQKKMDAGEEIDYEQLYRYDSLYYDYQVNEMGKFYRYIRSSNLVINPEGKPFDNNFSGFYKVLNPSGRTAEMIRLRNGTYDGVAKIYNPNNTLLTEESMDKQMTIRISYSDKGKPISTDTTFLKDNTTHSTQHYPSGKLSSRYISRPESEYFKEWAYYENGKLAYIKEQDKYLEAYDEKGNSTLTNGSGSFTQIIIDPLTNAVYKNVSEVKGNVLEGSYKNYINGKLSYESTYHNGVMVGKTYTFHPLNGKKLNEYAYSEAGEYLDDGYKEYPENYPSIKEAKIKVTPTFVTNFACMNMPSQQKGFQPAKCKNAGLLESSFRANPKAIFGDTEVLPEINSNMYYQQMVISETGKAKTIGFMADEATSKIFEQLEFEPATLEGKPVPSIMDINYLVKYY